MKCLLDRFGYSAADLDAPFLHDCTPNKPFVRFTQVSRVRQNSGTGTEAIDLVLHRICKLGKVEGHYG